MTESTKPSESRLKTMFDFEHQFAAYGEYHENKTNQIIHMIFVPLIMWSVQVIVLRVLTKVMLYSFVDRYPSDPSERRVFHHGVLQWLLSPSYSFFWTHHFALYMGPTRAGKYVQQCRFTCILFTNTDSPKLDHFDRSHRLLDSSDRRASNL